MEWPFVGREREIADLTTSLDVGGGALITGAAGVGKSRLLREVLGRFAQDGHRVFRTLATAASSRIPFAPFVAILPSHATNDVATLFRIGIDRLAGMRSRQGLIIGIDDAHYLDDGSLAMLTHIVTAEVATVAITTRSEPEEASKVDPVVAAADLNRIFVEALTEDATRRLIEAALGEVTRGLADELWRLSGGNPLLLQELIEGAIGRTIVEEDGRWSSTGSLTDTPRLAALVERRLHGLGEAERFALELVALGAPLPMAVASRVTDADSLLALERSHLVAVAADPVHGQVVIPAHPLYGEIVADHIGALNRRISFQRLLAAGADTEPGIDSLRLAIWQHESGTVADPDLASTGAGIALSRHDARLSEDLSRPIANRSPHAAVLLGRALSFQTRYEEAEEVLGGLDPADDDLLGEWASARAHNLAFGLARVEEAVALLSSASERVSDPALRGRLDAERGAISALPGDFDDTLAAARAVLDNPDAPGVARASAYVSLTLVQGMTADPGGLFEVVDDALHLAEAHSTELPLAKDQILIMKVHAQLISGRLVEATELAEQRHREVGDAGLMSPTWSLQLGQCFAESGRLGDATDLLRHAREKLKEFDPFRLELQAVGLLATAAGERGDASLSGEVGDVDLSHSQPRIEFFLSRGRAWQLAARGDAKAAAELSARAGERAVDGQHVTLASRSLHDAVRMGHPDMTRSLLEKVAGTSVGANLITAFRDHARALSVGDAESVADTAQRFHAMGATLWAAEAAAQAAALHFEAGAEAEASRSALRSIFWESRCQGSATPALAARPDVLTARELDTAIAAARGSASADIAKKLFVSVRTVDNHLGSVYRKLDIGGRDALAVLLGGREEPV